MKLVKDTDNKIVEANKVSDKEAEEAFKTILSWMGEDPNREGLLETPKRVVKAFPFLANEDQSCLQQIYNYSENNRGKYKIYDTVLDNKLLLGRNYELMQLHNTQIQSFTQLRVEEIINTPVKKIDKISFSKLITEDKMWNNIPNYHIWLQECFGKLNSFVE